MIDSNQIQMPYKMMTKPLLDPVITTKTTARKYHKCRRQMIANITNPEKLFGHNHTPAYAA